jgi:hypothetical protein
MQVSNKLAFDLDRILGNYRTFDKKPLTEGEVIVAMGFLLGNHVKTHVRVAKWLEQIAIAAYAASRKE